jgi:site-specific DNA-methyltransferase (adenine-specific)
MDDGDRLTNLPYDQVFLGDCTDVLPGFPEKSVDLVFADPPYNLQLRNDLWRPDSTLVDPVDDEWDRFESFAEYDEFTRRWLSACRRVLKDTGTIWIIGTYHNIFRIGSILQDLGFWTLNDIVWIKRNPMPNFRGVRFTNAHETLVWAQKVRGSRYTFNHHAMKALNDDLQMRSDWYLPICTGKERLKVNGKKAHATQKPEALLYRVILSTSNPGDLVLDPFFGTGTTGVIAKKLGRRWIGIEREESYVELARQRVASVSSSGDGELIHTHELRPPLPRIAVGALLEAGLLKPGQSLYFDNQDDLDAQLLANGHLLFRGTTGSIHQVGKLITNAPCNGWEHWYYQDSSIQNRQVINQLRQVIRDGMSLDR